MKAIGNESNESPSKSIPEDVRKEAEGQGGDYMQILEIPVTDWTDAMPVGNGTAVSGCVFNLSGKHRNDLIVRIEQIENLEVLPRDASMSYVILLTP